MMIWAMSQSHTFGGLRMEMCLFVQPGRLGYLREKRVDGTQV